MKLIAFLLFAVVIVSSSSVASESSVSIGISGGYVVLMHSGIFNFTNPEFSSKEYGQLRYSFSSGEGFRAAVNGVFTLDKADRFSLASCIEYSNISSKSDNAGESYPLRLPDGEPILTETYYRNKYSQEAISIDFDIRYKPFENNNFGGLIGMVGSYIVSNSYRFTYNIVFNPNNPGIPFSNKKERETAIVTPLDMEPIVKDFIPRYTDETRTSILFYEGELPDINPLQVSLRAGIFYDFTIKGIILSPSIVYHFPLTRISSSQDWKVSQLIGAFDVRIPL